MLDGFRKVDFMTALQTWNLIHKEVRCVYRQKMYTFTTDMEWLTDFKVNGGMILEGEWYLEV